MGRSPCCDKTKVKKGPWSPEEDATLKAYLEKNGTVGNWIALPKKAGLKRCGKSCRLRWLNYLRPDIKHGGFTEEEDNIIFTLYSKLGSRWSIIAARLQGRTDNDVKNHWNTKLKKRLLAASSSEATTPPPIAFPSTAEAYTSPTLSCWLSQTSMTIPSLPASTYGLNTNTQSLILPELHHHSLPELAEACEFGASMVSYSSPASQDSAGLNTNTQSLILPQRHHYSLPELAEAYEFGASVVSYSSPASQDSAGFSDFSQDSSFMPFSSNGRNEGGFFAGFGNGLPCEDFSGIWSHEMVSEVGGSYADLASFCLADTKMQGLSRRDQY